MAEIQTYPDGTPALSDKVPYIADPDGTPTLKLVDVGGLGGGGGGGGVVRTFDGSDFTDTVVAGGTWTAGADFAQTDTADSAHYLALATDIRYSPLHATIELEAKFPAGSGYTGVASLLDDAQVNYSQCVALRENTLYVIREGAAVDATITVAAAVDTWHTLKVVASGVIWSYYLNGQLVKTVNTMDHTGSIDPNGLGLYSQGTTSHFRNIRLSIR